MAEIKIYGTLVNATTDPKIAKTSQVFDEELNKYQSEINAQLGTSDDSLRKELTAFKNTKGKANGLASLDDSGKVPSTQLPSYVDDVLEFDQLDQLPKPGESGKIYVVTSTNLQYRWSGTDYVEISKSLALGETSSTAYPGDKGKATTDVVNSLSDNLVNDVLVSQSDKNSVSLTIKSITKNPVKKNKELLLVDGEPILLTDNTPILLADNVNDGLYDQADDKLITINQASSFTAGVMSASDKTKLDGLKSQAEIDTTINNVQNNLTTHINNKANPHQVTKEQVGLSNVDNTSDANKPISTATQNALNDKFSATEGNTLKQIVNDMPDLVVTGGRLRHNSDSVSLNLIQQNPKNPDDTDSILLKFNSVTDSTAGIILPSDKSKIDKIITNGNGTKYLSDNGTYKEVQGSSSEDLLPDWHSIKNVLNNGNEFNFADGEVGERVWLNYRSRSGNTVSARKLYIGNGQATGGFAEVHASGFFKESDVRLKSNIAPLNHTLDQICNIPTVEFDMHDKHQIGTIAQDLENNFAEIVNTDSDGMKSVDYCMLGVVAVEGIKLLKQEIEDLKKQVEELKNGNAILGRNL